MKLTVINKNLTRRYEENERNVSIGEMKLDRHLFNDGDVIYYITDSYECAPAILLRNRMYYVLTTEGDENEWEYTNKTRSKHAALAMWKMGQ